MIYTLTANPAVDLNETCDHVAPNSVVRTRDAVFTPNGKGLNVSFTLAHYGVPTRILGFFAGFTGDYVVAGARERGVDVVPVGCGGITRVNLLLSVEGGDEYKFVNAGASIDAAAEERMLFVISSAQDMECLVVSGSLPPGTSPDFLDRVVDVARGAGADVVLDISSLKLVELAPRKPLLIKPNDDELRDIFGLEVRTDDEVRAAMAHLHGLGFQNVLLTLGGKGACFSNGAEVWRTWNKAPVDVLSTACAGDATLGSFLSIWYRERDRVEDALRLCQATGASVCESPGLGDFSRVGEFASEVEVVRL